MRQEETRRKKKRKEENIVVSTKIDSSVSTVVELSALDPKFESSVHP